MRSKRSRPQVSAQIRRETSHPRDRTSLKEVGAHPVSTLCCLKCLGLRRLPWTRSCGLHSLKLTLMLTGSQEQIRRNFMAADSHRPTLAIRGAKRHGFSAALRFGLGPSTLKHLPPMVFSEVSVLPDTTLLKQLSGNVLVTFGWQSLIHRSISSS